MTIAEADTNVATAAVVVVMTANAIAAAAIVASTAEIAVNAAIRATATAGPTHKSCSRNAPFRPRRRAHAKRPQAQDC